MGFLNGVIGFVGFESLRVYRRAWGGKRFPPSRLLWLYIPSCIGIALLSGFLADAIATNNPGGAIFVGFSVPSGIKTVLGSDGRSVGTHVDDVVLAAPTTGDRVRFWLRLMFECC